MSHISNRYTLDRRAQRGHANFAFAPGAVHGYRRRPYRTLRQRAADAGKTLLAILIISAAGTVFVSVAWLAMVAAAKALGLW